MMSLLQGKGISFIEQRMEFVWPLGKFYSLPMTFYRFGYI